MNDAVIQEAARRIAEKFHPERIILFGSRVRGAADERSDAVSLRDAEELTQFVITAGYPGEDEIVEKSEAIRAIEQARQVRMVVRNALSESGLVLDE
jgi:predicted nucleotidyltransferase